MNYISRTTYGISRHFNAESKLVFFDVEIYGLPPEYAVGIGALSGICALVLGFEIGVLLFSYPSTAPFLILGAVIAILL